MTGYFVSPSFLTQQLPLLPLASFCFSLFGFLRPLNASLTNKSLQFPLVKGQLPRLLLTLLPSFKLLFVLASN